MIIDCHGHFTTAPVRHFDWRSDQVEADRRGGEAPSAPQFSDDDLRAGLEPHQVAAQDRRGIDVTLLSPHAGHMGHHLATLAANTTWTRLSNDLVHRACLLYPTRFAGVCQLPQAAGVTPGSCVAELRRCVEELGFVGCNLNPDPTGGYWKDPPLTDRYWYPLYEALVELDVPAMIHTASSGNPNFQGTGDHYINGDTTAFMQLLRGNLFGDFPTLRLVIPHGGGAVPYHWGRYRGLAQDLKQPPLEQHLLRNVFFDTCVYHQPGIDLLADVIPADNLLFGSETIGAVRGIDPTTGHDFDDTRRYVDATPALSEDERQRVFHQNVMRIYPRLSATAPLRARSNGGSN